MRLDLLILAAIGLSDTWAVESFAQTVEGVEAGRLRDAAKAQSKDARAFADEVTRRGEALRDEALLTRRAAQANQLRAPTPTIGKPAQGVFDFDQMVADAGIARAGPASANGPRFIAFASMSMPVGALRAMIRDVSNAGGFIVFRGFQNNSVKAFGAAMVKVVDKGQSTKGIGIDPRLFRAFNVTAVPAYVVTTSDIALCEGFSCKTPLPPHDRMDGNVTTGFALETFRAGGGPGAAASRVYLQRLNAARSATSSLPGAR